KRIAVRDFSFDLAQSARDHLELVSRENSGGSESGGMRDGSGNIVSIKPSIERNRFAITLSDLGRRGRKSFGSHDRVDWIIARDWLSRKHGPRQVKQIYALRLRPCAGESA